MQDTVVSACVVCTRKTNFSPTCCTLLSQESIQTQKCRFIIKMFLMLPNNSDFLVVIILPCPEIKNYWVMSVLCFSHFIKLFFLNDTVPLTHCSTQLQSGQNKDVMSQVRCG